LGDKVDEMPRRYYNSVKLRERKRPPHGFEIMTVKTALEDRSLKGQTGWFNAFRPDTCSFLRSGIGYCVVKNNQIVAWCITICVRDCVDKGLRPEWHCRESNSASIGVAEKIGFSDPVHYKSLFLNLTKGL